MSQPEPILPDDDDATVRRKVLAELDGESRAKMAQSLDNPRYLAAVRAAAGKRAETAPHRSLVPTEIIRVIEDLRQRDPESRERGEAVWRDPAAVAELTRALANEKARLRAKLGVSEERDDDDEDEAPASTPTQRKVIIALAAVVLAAALASAVILVLGDANKTPAPSAAETETTAAVSVAAPATEAPPQDAAPSASAVAAETPTAASGAPATTASVAPANVKTVSTVATPKVRGDDRPPNGSHSTEPIISKVPF